MVDPKQRDVLVRFSHADRAKIITTQVDFEKALAEVDATIAYALWETDIPPSIYVHPKVYAQRAECPLWTNEPNAVHVHNRDCKG